MKNVPEARNCVSKLSYDPTWLAEKNNLQTWLRDMMTWTNGHEVIKNYWTRHGQEVLRFNISAILICDSKIIKFQPWCRKSPRITLLHNCKTTVLLFTCRHDSMIWWPRTTGNEVIKNYWARRDQEVFRFSISVIVICNSKNHNSRFDVEKWPRITLLHNCETTVLLFTCRHDSQT